MCEAEELGEKKIEILRDTTQPPPEAHCLNTEIQAPS